MNPDVVRRINEAFNKVMAMPAISSKLAGGGLEPIGGTPAQFGRFIDTEISKWTKIARDVGAKAD
jgi:tripartite-type tricarboxylate transporter receptor subunit TctC